MRNANRGIPSQDKRKLRQCATVLFAVALTSLAGCTTGSRATADGIKLLFTRDPSPTEAQIAANRFPQAYVTADDISGVIVLGYVDDGQQVWYAGNHAILHSNAEGLFSGISKDGEAYESQIVGSSPFQNLNTITAATQVSRKYDWLPDYKMGVEVTGTLARVGRETVEIGGRSMELIRFKEQLHGGGMSGTNTYWVDPGTGFIWKSKQYLAPDYAIEVVQLKPYKPAGR
ncbi:YjbF family lipoprotein [Stenotrophomonas sp.]|uniref:YjbF family lipoprotein n=1 Tax=Stenotrophomonas sp. TaxID=69392 RepID=UPI0028A5A934|nr:YjbF family lipoprotein [Stenotrophomonas sp.]